MSTNPASRTSRTPGTFSQLPGPQRQPEDDQGQEPHAELEYRYGPEPDVLDEGPIHTRPHNVTSQAGLADMTAR